MPLSEILHRLDGGDAEVALATSSAPWRRRAADRIAAAGFAPSAATADAIMRWDIRLGALSFEASQGARSRMETVFRPRTLPLKRLRRLFDRTDPGLEGLGLRPYTLEFMQLEALAHIDIAAPVADLPGEVVWRWTRPVPRSDFLCLSLPRSPRWSQSPATSARLTAVSLSGGVLRTHHRAEPARISAVLSGPAFGLLLDSLKPSPERP